MGRFTAQDGACHDGVSVLDSPLRKRAALYVDASGLNAFRVDLSAARCELAPGETRDIEARVTMDAAQAKGLVPLYYEAADLFAGVEGAPDSIAPWNWGYMRQRLHGVAPLPARPAPVLLRDAEGAAGRARLQGQAASVATPQQLRTADALMAYATHPPDIIHGNPNQYFCPEHNAQLRFEGAGRHRCDKGRELVDEAKMPDPVLRAAYYAHHSALAKASLTLAQAGWDSGERKYLQRAAEILMAYARKYPAYPISDPSATGFYAHVGLGNLHESWWYAPLARAYDLVRTAGVWSDTDAAFVARNLAICGDTVVVLDQVMSARPVRMDRFTYLPNDIAEARSTDGDITWTPDAEFIAASPHYRYFTEPQRAQGAVPERILYPLDPRKKYLGLLQLLAPAETRCYRLRAPVGWHPREVPVLALHRADATTAWFAETLTGLDKATPDTTTLTRVEVRQHDTPLPPEQALAVRVRNTSGEYLVLTSTFDGLHRVDGREMQGPLGVLRVEP